MPRTEIANYASGFETNREYVSLDEARRLFNKWLELRKTRENKQISSLVYDLIQADIFKKIEPTVFFQLLAEKHLDDLRQTVEHFFARLDEET